MLGIMILLIPAPSFAYRLDKEQSPTVEKKQIVNGTYYALGSEINVEGTINGDLICAGQNVIVNGPVNGDVLCMAQSIKINGPVAGNIRLLGQTVTINTSIAKNASVLSQTMNLGSSGDIRSELMSQSQQTILDGRVGGEAYGSTISLQIGGDIDGKVSFTANEVSINSGARLLSGLSYISLQKAQINKDSEILGPITQSKPNQTNKLSTPQLVTNIISAWVFTFLSSLLIGLAIVWLAPRFMSRVTLRHSKRQNHQMLWGLAALIFVPLASLVIMVTVIGAPIAIITLLAWAIAIYISKIFTAIIVGNVILNAFIEYKKGSPPARPYVSVTVGILICTLLFSIPLLGPIFVSLATLFGLGIISIEFRDKIDQTDISSSNT